MAKSIKDLKKQVESVPVTPVENTQDEQKSKLSNLAPAETPAAQSETKSQLKTLSEEDQKKYLEILQDGKPHKIQDLLKTFNLPSTTSGREKLRAVNRMINQSGTHEVVGVFLEGKHFQLVEASTGGKVVEKKSEEVSSVAPAPVETVTQ